MANCLLQLGGMLVVSREIVLLPFVAFGTQRLQVPHIIGSAPLFWDLVIYMQDDPVFAWGAATLVTALVAQDERPQRLVDSPAGPGHGQARNELVGRRVANPFPFYVDLSVELAQPAVQVLLGPRSHFQLLADLCDGQRGAATLVEQAIDLPLEHAEPESFELLAVWIRKLCHPRQPGYSVGRDP